MTTTSARATPERTLPLAPEATAARRGAFLAAAAYHEEEYREARSTYDRLMATPDEVIDLERGTTCAQGALWFKRDCGVHRVAAWQMRLLAGLSPDELEAADVALVGKNGRGEAGR